MFKTERTEFNLGVKVKVYSFGRVELAVGISNLASPNTIGKVPANSPYTNTITGYV